MADLIDALVDMAKPVRHTRIGRVVTTSPFRVTFHDDATAVALPRLTAYEPTVGDMVLVVGESNVVVGAVVPADSSAAQTVPTRSY